jgi:hypothetical protein
VHFCDFFCIFVCIIIVFCMCIFCIFCVYCVHFFLCAPFAFLYVASLAYTRKTAWWTPCTCTPATYTERLYAREQTYTYSRTLPGWAKLQAIWATTARHGRKECGTATTNAGCSQQMKVQKQKGLGIQREQEWGGSALKILISGEWEVQQHVHGVRTFSSEKD